MHSPPPHKQSNKVYIENSLRALKNLYCCRRTSSQRKPKIHLATAFIALTLLIAIYDFAFFYFLCRCGCNLSQTQLRSGLDSILQLMKRNIIITLVECSHSLSWRMYFTNLLFWHSRVDGFCKNNCKTYRSIFVYTFDIYYARHDSKPQNSVYENTSIKMQLKLDCTLDTNKRYSIPLDFISNFIELKRVCCFIVEDFLRCGWLSRTFSNFSEFNLVTQSIKQIK